MLSSKDPRKQAKIYCFIRFNKTLVSFPRFCCVKSINGQGTAWHHNLWEGETPSLFKTLWLKFGITGSKSMEEIRRVSMATCNNVCRCFCWLSCLTNSQGLCFSRRLLAERSAADIFSRDL